MPSPESDRPVDDCNVTAVIRFFLGLFAVALSAISLSSCPAEADGIGHLLTQESGQTRQSGEGVGDPRPRTSPPGTQPILRSIAEMPSSHRIRKDVRELVRFGTRHTLSDTTSDERGIGATRRWARAELERISEACGGCLEVSYQRRTVSGEWRIPDSTAVVNVLALQRGTTDPDRRVVVSADLDSRASDVMDATGRAPGANDNASGVASVLEAARILSRHEFGATIVYALLSGAEQGLIGGEIAADMARDRGWEIEAVLHADMIGNIQGRDEVVDNTVVRVFSQAVRDDAIDRLRRWLHFTGGENDSPSRNLARYVAGIADDYVRNLDVLPVYRQDRFGRGGQHIPFNHRGYPAVRITEAHEDHRRQRQDVRVEDGVEYGDVPGQIEFGYAAKATGLTTAAVASLAWAPPPPTCVSVEGAGRPGTTLSWQPIDPDRAPNLAGYRVYWRRTDAPEWTKSVYVGDVAEHTLADVVIDNFFFGVTSVSREGFESPVVFPGPLGAFRPVEWRDCRSG